MGMRGLALTSKICDSYKAWSNAYFGGRLGGAPDNVIIRLLWLAAILRSFHHVTGTVKVTTSSCFPNVTTGYILNHLPRMEIVIVYSFVEYNRIICSFDDNTVV